MNYQVTSADPEIDDEYRGYGSLNVWAITPASPYWEMY